MKYIYTYILLIATLSNFLNSWVLMDHFDSWYDVIHKWQLLVILIAGYFYQNNLTNFLALSGYAVIIILNWIIYHLGGTHEIYKELSIYSSYLYVGALIYQILKEKLTWK